MKPKLLVIACAEEMKICPVFTGRMNELVKHVQGCARWSSGRSISGRRPSLLVAVPDGYVLVVQWCRSDAQLLTRFGKYSAVPVHPPASAMMETACVMRTCMH
jgi:hypothetical protein